MTIDKKYSSLPTLRRTAKLLWPLWLLLVAIKTAYVAAPLHSSAEYADKVYLGMLVGSGLIGVGLWLLAGLGSKKERVQTLMMLNIMVVLSTAMHFMRIIRQHLPSSDTEGDEDRSAFEATALKEVLSSYIPSMQKINDLDTVVEQAGTVVNAAILLVSFALVGCLHTYIAEKKGGGTDGQTQRKIH